MPKLRSGKETDTAAKEPTTANQVQMADDNQASPILERLAATLDEQVQQNRANQEFQRQMLEFFTRSSQASATADPESATAGGSTTSVHATPRSRQPDPNKPPLLQASATLEEYDTWRESWADYTNCFDFESLPRPRQLAQLRSFLSTEMKSELTHGVGIPSDTNMSTEEVLIEIRNYLRSRRNVALDRVAFEERVQEKGESFDEFHIALRKIAANADLCTDCFDARLTTRIMVGVKDPEARKKLLALRPFPTLQQAVDLCRSEESARANEATLSGDKVKHVNRTQNRGRSQSRYRREKDQKSKGSKPNGGVGKPAVCSRCGKEHPKDKNKCPAYGKDCSKCGKSNHFASQCRTRNDDGDPQQGSSNGGGRSMGQIRKRVATTQRAAHDKAPKMRVSVYLPNAHSELGSITATADTGAEGTVAGPDILRSLGIDPNNLEPDAGEATLEAANGSALEIIGSAVLAFKYHGKWATDRVYFCKNIRGMLLPCYVLQKLCVVTADFPRPLKIGSIKEGQTENSAETILLNLPKNPTDAEISAIKDKLLVHFSDVFDTSTVLGEMDGPPMAIKIKDGAEPFSVRAARQIPIAWRDEIKAEIEKMEAAGVIVPVGMDASEWCHPLVCVPKPNGGIRVCVDLTKLNDHVVRPLYPLKTPKEAVSNISNSAKFFTVFDAKKGYWQMKLHPDSQHLTTFITPWGRFRYVRAPMGLISTGDEFCRVGDEALSGVPNLEKVVDDCIVFDEEFPQHIRHVWECLERCRKRKITLCPNKLQFAKSEVQFCGYAVSKNGVKPDHRKMEAIANFPKPQTRQDLRSFLGLAIQLSQFSPDLSGMAEPLRPLLCEKNAFQWTPEANCAFENVKKTLTDLPVLAHFDPNLPTCVQTDASRKHGLGYILMQKHGNKWRYVECGSRFLTPAESRYAMVELELQGVVWAVDKCRIYLQGLPGFVVMTDHKPLLAILNRYTLADIQNPRLLRLREKLIGYQFTAEWVKGKDHKIPDALSRAPVSQPDEDVYAFEKEVNPYGVLKVKALEIDYGPHDQSKKGRWLEDLQDAADSDPTYQRLRDAVLHGFPERRKDLDVDVQSFWPIRDQLSVEDGIVLYGARIVVPETARKEVLVKLHTSHQGIVKSKQRARPIIYWPGLSSDIETMVRKCSGCQENLPSKPKETMLSDPVPQWVFQEVSADLFSHGPNQYLVYIDRLSGWISICVFHRHAPSAKEVIEAVRKWFVDFGVPTEFRSDNGPQFASQEFRKFLKRWGVKHFPSTPTYPQSNGLAEVAVKIMKNLIDKTVPNGCLTEEFWQGLLEYRNTPRYLGISPAEFIFGHPMRSMIPTHHSHFSSKWQDIAQKADKIDGYKAEAAQYYDRSAHHVGGSRLRIGDRVRIQDANSKKWDRIGTIVGIGKYRDCMVKLPSGRVFWRNRRFLTKDTATTDESEPENKNVDEGSTPKRKTVRFEDEGERSPRRSLREKKKPDFFSAS